MTKHDMTLAHIARRGHYMPNNTHDIHDDTFDEVRSVAKEHRMNEVDIDIAHDLVAMAVAIRDRAPDDASPEEESVYDELICNAMDEANTACDVAGIERVFDELDYP